jgi:hypothetical protein
MFDLSIHLNSCASILFQLLQLTNENFSLLLKEIENDLERQTQKAVSTSFRSLAT